MTGRKSALQRDLTVAVLLVAAVFVVYSPSLSGGFLDWDDIQYLHENPELRLPWPEAVGQIVTTPWFANYNPLHRLLNLALWKGFGDDPLPFRLASVGLHLAAGWLLFLILREWIGRTAPAAAAAILFAMHPSNVENVAWISETKMLLCAVFGFGALLAWMKFRRGWRPGYAVALGLFTLALASKTSIIVLPALFFLLDAGRKPRPALRAYLPFAVPAVFFAVMQVWSAAQPWDADGRVAISELHGGSPWTHAATVIAVLPRYALGALSPFGQSGLHRFEDVTSVGDVRLWLGVVLLAATAVFALRSLRSGNRRFAIAAIWFVLTLLPTLVVPIPIVYAERYLYLGMPFLLVLVTEPLLREGRPGRTLRTAAVTAGVVLYAAFGALYAHTWKDDVSLWERAVRVDGEARKGWMYLGESLARAGDARAALGAYRRAHEIEPDSSTVQQRLAMAEADAGYVEKGLSLMRDLADREEDSATWWANLAMLEDRAGDEQAAALTFRRGLTLHPEDAYLWKNLGKFHLNHGRLPMGAKALEHAARHDPDDAETWQLLADVYRRAGLPEEVARCESELEGLVAPLR